MPVNPFRYPRFVGRTGEGGEMSLLAGELARAQAGDAVIVIVDGAPGVGKSRLLREFVDLALTRNCLALRLSLREHESLTALLQSLASQLHGVLAADASQGQRERPYVRLFGAAAERVGAWAMALGPTVTLATGDATAMAWSAAGSIALPLLKELLDHLADKGTSSSPLPAIIARLLDALAAINGALAQNRSSSGLVLVFDQWEALRDRASDDLHACEEFSLALHQRLRDLPQSQAHVLPVFGVRSDARADTIGRLHNASSVRSIIANPLDEDACADLLQHPVTSDPAYPGAFDLAAARRCCADSGGNPEHLILLASDLWFAAQQNGVSTIGAAFYDQHAPGTIARAVAARVERFRSVHRHREVQAQALLSALADAPPDHPWRAGELASQIGDADATLLQGMLDTLSRQEIDLLAYDPARGAFLFPHDLRWRGLRQYLRPEEPPDAARGQVALWKLRDWFRERGEGLEATTQVQMCTQLLLEAARLGNMRVLGEAIAELAEVLLHSDSAAARRDAAVALGTYPFPGAAPPLIAALHDPDETVRLAAVAAVSTIRTDDARRALLAALLDSSEKVAADAAIGLMHHPSPEVLAALGDALCSDRRRVRIAAALVLGQSKVPQGASVLFAYIRSSDATAREAAAMGLENVQTLAAVDALAAAMSDEAESVRSTALHALKGIADSEPSATDTEDEGRASLARDRAREVLDALPPPPPKPSPNPLRRWSSRPRR